MKNLAERKSQFPCLAEKQAWIQGRHFSSIVATVFDHQTLHRFIQWCTLENWNRITRHFGFCEKKYRDMEFRPLEIPNSPFCRTEWFQIHIKIDFFSLSVWLRKKLAFWSRCLEVLQWTQIWFLAIRSSFQIRIIAFDRCKPFDSKSYHRIRPIPEQLSSTAYAMTEWFPDATWSPVPCCLADHPDFLRHMSLVENTAGPWFNWTTKVSCSHLAVDISRCWASCCAEQTSVSKGGLVPHYRARKGVA